MPFGRLGTSESNQPGFLLAIENTGNRGTFPWFAAQDRFKTFLDQALPGPMDGRGAGVEGFRDVTVAPTLADTGNISLEQNPRLQGKAGCVGPFMDDRLKRLAFFGTQPDDVFPDRGI